MPNAAFERRKTPLRNHAAGKPSELAARVAVEEDDLIYESIYEMKTPPPPAENKAPTEQLKVTNST